MSTAPTMLRRAAPPKKKPWISGHRFLVLFVFLLLYLIVYPYLDRSRSVYISFRILAAAATLYTVYAINLKRTLLVCGFLLAIPALLQHVLQFRADQGALSVLNIVLSFSFDIFVVVIIFRRVFSRGEPDSETILGALCIYLLISFSFAGIYGMLATLEPRAFYLDPLINAHAIPNRFDLLYYSFGTITTLGATGISPVSSEVRSMSVIEATLGLLYIAVLIARLVSAYKEPIARSRQ